LKELATQLKGFYASLSRRIAAGILEYVGVPGAYSDEGIEAFRKAGICVIMRMLIDNSHRSFATGFCSTSFSIGFILE